MTASTTALALLFLAVAGAVALPSAQAHPAVHVVCARAVVVQDPTACTTLRINDRSTCEYYDCTTIITLEWTMSGVDVCSEVGVYGVASDSSCGYICTEVQNLEPIYCKGSMTIVTGTWAYESFMIPGWECSSHSDGLGRECKEWEHQVQVIPDWYTGAVPDLEDVEVLATFIVRSVEDAAADPLP